mmetsp:Transcript_34421/g.31118  ORF Transcript_34421/g.31118 Transcript_34421/m.31118 type:complete len:107 (+) Transcript_34421:725-1045(+)
MLELSKVSISMGLTDYEQNNKIMFAILHIFSSFNPNEESLLKDYWVREFMLSNALSKEHEIFEKIYAESMEILVILDKVRLNYQINGFLKILKFLYENKINVDPER